MSNDIKTFKPDTICLRCFRERKDKPYGYCFSWGNYYKKHIWNKEEIELKTEKFIQTLNTIIEKL